MGNSVNKDGKENCSFTSAEIASLWNQYLCDSLAICVYKYFLNNVVDKEVKAILEYALQLSQDHIAQITEFFKQDQFQIPMGFTEKDVNLNAPRLFSDDFYVFYTTVMTAHGITAYSLSIATTDRKDIRKYYFNCTENAYKLIDKGIQYTQSKGIHSTPPSIPSPKSVNFVEKTGIITDLFGERRPLYAAEISNLYFNTKHNALNQALYLAFSQVAQNEDVLNFMLFGVEKAGKDINSFVKILEQEHLSTPKMWNDDITNSTVSPFSDKLMMFHMAFLTSAALSFYGTGLASSMRPDIIMTYNNIFENIHTGSRKIFSIMVKYGWLEKQPEAIDRKSLAQNHFKLK
ncbi:DUF3231 family protein [Oceanobacillus massiliensis]|uniref:DUF3231 family protein n=1 Tax=Oceanobacillus massiliensis TaxID=1465765 RepID=UPI0002888521|nr:DUF3231 family protein [Oceanobacillus massiliensis]